MSQAIMFARIWQLLIKEVIQVARDRLLAVFVFTFPLLQLVLVAQTAGGDVVNLPLAVMDQDHSPVSRRLVQLLNNTEELNLRYIPATMDELKRLLDSGRAAAAVVIPAGFMANLFNPHSQAQVQVLVDGTNISSGRQALVTSEGAIADYLSRLVAETSAGHLALSPIELQTAIRFNPRLSGKYVALPGLLAFTVYQVAMVVASVGLVRERELGTLEQLVVTPVKRSELLIGKAIPAVVIATLNFAGLLQVVVRGFHIPMRGSWALLFLLSEFFIVSEVAVGLMISAVARSQQQAVLIVFPLAMIELSLSGYLVPVENMPPALQVLSAFSPLRHYMAMLKAVMLKAADLTTLWPAALALVGLAVAYGLVSLRNVARSFD